MKGNMLNKLLLSLLAVVAITTTSFSQTIYTGTYPTNGGNFGTTLIFVPPATIPANATKIVMRTSGGSTSPIIGMEHASLASPAPNFTGVFTLNGDFGVIDGNTYRKVYAQRLKSISSTFNATVFDGWINFGGTSGNFWDYSFVPVNTSNYFSTTLSPVMKSSGFYLYYTRNVGFDVTGSDWFEAFYVNYDNIETEWYFE